MKKYYYVLIVTCTLSTYDLFALFERDRAFIAKNKGDWNTAQTHLHHCLARNEGNPELIYDAAVAAHQLEKHEVAAHYFQEVAEHPQTSAQLKERALFNCGNCCYKQNKLKEACQQYESALALNPENTHAQNNLEIVKKMMQEQEKNNQNNEQNKDKNNQNDDQQKDNNKDDSQSQENQKKQSDTQQQNKDKDQKKDSSDNKDSQQNKSEQSKSDKEESTDKNQQKDQNQDKQNNEKNQNNSEQNKSENRSDSSDQKKQQEKESDPDDQRQNRPDQQPQKNKSQQAEQSPLKEKPSKQNTSSAQEKKNQKNDSPPLDAWTQAVVNAQNERDKKMANAMVKAMVRSESRGNHEQHNNW